MRETDSRNSAKRLDAFQRWMVAAAMELRISDQSRISVSKDQVSCDLAGEVAILNLKNGVYYGLDPIGANIWTLIQEPRTFAEVREALLDRYEVDQPRLESDLRELLAQLADQGLIDVA
jgi:Coenzyme PQQ synthesis protein D (PqqD)